MIKLSLTSMREILVGKLLEEKIILIHGDNLVQVPTPIFYFMKNNKNRNQLHPLRKKK